MSKYLNLYTELVSLFKIIVPNTDLQFSPEAASITLAVFSALTSVTLDLRSLGPHAEPSEVEIMCLGQEENSPEWWYYQGKGRRSP